VTDADVTLKNHCCCVTLSAVENMLLRLNNKLFGKITEVLFVVLFRQGNWAPQETLFSLFFIFQFSS